MGEISSDPGCFSLVWLQFFLEGRIQINSNGIRYSDADVLPKKKVFGEIRNDPGCFSWVGPGFLRSDQLQPDPQP